MFADVVSTHSRPKAAALTPRVAWWRLKFQLTAARRRLLDFLRGGIHARLFQLTAARRRLRSCSLSGMACFRFQLTAARRRLPGKLTQNSIACEFQLTAARRRLHKHPIERPLA